VKRVVYLATAVLVAMLILVPTAMAQATKLEVTKTTEATVEGKLPPSGGPAVASVLLPAGALLLGSGVLAYAVLRRR
jgi:hypothetical protein